MKKRQLRHIAQKQAPSNETCQMMENPEKITRIQNVEPVICLDCQICLMSKSIKQFCSLSSCHHLYCSQCLRQHIAANIFANRIKIKCINQKCDHYLTEFSKIFTTLPNHLKQKYFRFSTNQVILENPSLKHCPTLNCLQVLVIQPPHPFRCDVCKIDFCSLCFEITHQGNCTQKLYDMVSPYGFKNCPQCFLVVQKSEGCIHMTCVCGFEFCYVCGKKYMKDGSCHQEVRFQNGNRNNSRRRKIGRVFLIIFMILCAFLFSIAYACMLSIAKTFYFSFYLVPAHIVSMVSDPYQEAWLRILLAISLLLTPLMGILLTLIKMVYWATIYWSESFQLMKSIYKGNDHNFGYWWRQVRWVPNIFRL